ncbi:epoxyqueuosine reductase [Rhodoblastus acidophilus]|uniref:Epoxyqueuosine reductase n=2 Tax=Rhodoblastus acidophilus TaxID=1074 RepID=A0A212RZK8_RHOAC|nr:epoxyqueuosine reductase [Rhodoblastus acidophilus]
MDWLGERRDRRADPRKLWPDVRSIVMLGINYGPDLAPVEPNAGAISVYARNRDYHDVIKGKLKQLAGAFLAFARAQAGVEGEVKVFVDTAPVMEKPLAAAAGLGWQGKHTNLVSRQFGSWLFLGSIFTNLDLPADPPEADHCGKCRACVDACPTGALDSGKIDARLCVSYLTIETKGQIPAGLREKIGNRIYGCDDCLAVCPWNKFAQTAREAKFSARADLVAPPLAELAALDEAAFRQKFSGNPVKRIGHARFLRNVLLAIGNSGDGALAPLAKARLGHESALVRGMAVWALARLLPRDEFASLAAKNSDEPDPDVRSEWGTP